MRIDQAWKKRPAAAINFMLDRALEIFSALDDLFDPAFIIDDQPAEALKLAIRPNLHAVDVGDEGFGKRRRRSKQRGQSDQRPFHGRFDSIVCRSGKV